MSLRNRQHSVPDLEVASSTNDKAPEITAAEVSDPPKPTSKETMSHFSEKDEEEDINMWIANYERKQFRFISLLPPLTWFPIYWRHINGRSTHTDMASMGALPYSLKGDLIAGLTVGFMLVPQSLAFALLAGLPVQIGLYASFAPLIVYTLMGTIRQVQPGPTALMSLLTAQALDSAGLETEGQRIMGAALLALLVGLISMLFGAMRLGFVVDFMSHSVMAAFCSAAGVTIATSQLKHLFGIAMPRKKYWWQTASYLLTNLTNSDPATCFMGCTLLVVLLTLKQWKAAGSAEKRKAHFMWRWLPTDKTSTQFKIVKFIADLSSMLAVLVGWLWGLAYRTSGHNSVKLVGEVEGSGFHFVAPGNGIDDGIDFNTLLVSAAVMAVVGFLETMAVGGKFAMQARYDYDANQELLALGFANVMGAVMSGYPTTGSFSRTAVNAMLGATSLVACASSATIVALAVYFLLPVISLLPLASLAPIIIQGAIGVINVHDFVVAWGASRAEFLVMAATFVMSLALTVKEGLLLGFVLSVLKTMNDLANPNIAICGRLSDNSFRDIRNFPQAEILSNAVVVRMDARLSFANSRKMKEFCVRAVQVREAKGDHIQFVIVDGKSINHVDLTGCEMLEVLAESLQSQGKQLILANLKGPVSKYLYSAGVPQVVTKHCGHLCIDMDQAIDIVNGADPTSASKMLEELVRRVDSAKLIMSAATANPIYACGGVRCSTNLSNQENNASSTRPSRISRELTPSTDTEACLTPPSSEEFDATPPLSAEEVPTMPETSRFDMNMQQGSQAIAPAMKKLNDQLLLEQRVDKSDSAKGRENQSNSIMI